MTFVHYSKAASAALFALMFSSLAMAADTGWHLEAGWVRAVPPNARTTAAYLDVVNHSDRPVVMVAARSSVSGRTEIHDMQHDNGLMKMVKLDQLEVPAHGRVSLAPGGKHVMLMELSRVPQDGTEVEVCLQDQARVEQCLALPVQRDAPGTSAHDHQGHTHTHHGHSHH